MNEPTYSSCLHKLHFVHSFTHSRIFIAPLRGNHSEGIPPQQGEKEQLAEDHKMCQKVFCGRGQGEQLKVVCRKTFPIAAEPTAQNIDLYAA